VVANGLAVVEEAVVVANGLAADAFTVVVAAPSCIPPPFVAAGAVVVPVPPNWGVVVDAIPNGLAAGAFVVVVVVVAGPNCVPPPFVVAAGCDALVAPKTGGCCDAPPNVGAAVALFVGAAGCGVVADGAVVKPNEGAVLPNIGGAAGGASVDPEPFVGGAPLKRGAVAGAETGPGAGVFAAFDPN